MLLAVSGFAQTKKDYFWSGVKKYNLKDFSGAVAEFNKALEIDLKREDAWYYRGLTRYELHDNNGAMTDFNRTLEIYPEYMEAYCGRGLVK